MQEVVGEGAGFLEPSAADHMEQQKPAKGTSWGNNMQLLPGWLLLVSF